MDAIKSTWKQMVQDAQKRQYIVTPACCLHMEGIRARKCYVSRKMLEIFLLDMLIVNNVRLRESKINKTEAVHIGILEVESIFPIIFAQTNVVWFYVVMDDSTFMNMLEQCRDFDTNLPHCFLRKPYSFSFINYLLETHSHSIGSEAVSISAKSFVHNLWKAVFEILLRL